MGTQPYIVIQESSMHPFKKGERVCLDRYDEETGMVTVLNRTGLGGQLLPGDIIPLVDNEKTPHSFPKIKEEFKKDSKQSNPKDSIASDKLAFGLVPDTLKAYAALGFTEGALKYGAYNWRLAGARASVYRNALDRHMSKWWNGEDIDPDTGVPHLASALCNIGILIDCSLLNNLEDDRPPAVDVGNLLKDFEEKMRHLKEMFKDYSPKHYTIRDGTINESD